MCRVVEKLDYWLELELALRWGTEEEKIDAAFAQAIEFYRFSKYKCSLCGGGLT